MSEAPSHAAIRALAAAPIKITNIVNEHTRETLDGPIDWRHARPQRGGGLSG